MELYIMDTNFVMVGTVDVFESLIWTDRYQECGDVQIDMKVLDSDLLIQEYYLYSKDSVHTMIIEQRLTKTDSDDGDVLTVKGRSLESILDRRVIWGSKTISGNLQTAIQTLLNECIISPTNADRKISNFKFTASTDTRITPLTIDSTALYGDNLYDVICTLCSDNGIGFKVILDADNNFVFSLYKGIDRTYEQTDVTVVVFSPKLDNITATSFLESKKLLKNVAFVAGGTNTDNSRTITSVGSGTGLARREMFSDASGIATTDDDGNAIASSTYLSEITTQGTSDLEDNTEINTLTGTIEATGVFIYGKDFQMGDIVEVTDKYGNDSESYISEVIMSQSTDDGFSIIPSFEAIDDGAVL